MFIPLSLDFTVVKPDLGLFFWSTIFFLLFWFLVGRLAFKPIAEALRKRQTDIQDALDAAAKAKDEMNQMQAKNDQLLVEAREERNRLIKEAKETQIQMINEAKEKAKSEANRLITSAQEEISNQKKAAMKAVKNDVGQLAIGIAEQVLRKDLKGDKEQTALVEKLVGEIKLN